MSKISSALKLYIKAAANPFIIGFGLFMMIGMSIAFIVAPDAVGSKDYISMLEAIQMGNVGIVCMVIYANTKIKQNKFYSSCNCAKELFVFGPVFVAIVLNVLYNAVLAVSAYINLGTVGLADLLVFNTVSSVLLIIICGSHGKKDVPFIALIQIISYVAFMLFPIILKIASRLQAVLQAMLGLPLITSVIIHLSGYVLAVIATIAIEKYWWKKGDKFVMPNQAMMNALEGAEKE
ncbi:hypothetical protein [Ruminococcus flavefaciens]|uniref:hypothetical protein n=1 Tax=Ruminococcus flavefaciens TaxID=1265 RepID=UPI0004652174|nr:hypothetical protein [Ruminococcus flavefaciens]